MQLCHSCVITAETGTDVAVGTEAAFLAAELLDAKVARCCKLAKHTASVPETVLSACTGAEAGMRTETGVRAETGTEVAVGIGAGLSAAADPLTPRPQAARYPNPRNGGQTTMPDPLTSSAMAGSSGQSKDCLPLIACFILTYKTGQLSDGPERLSGCVAYASSPAASGLGCQAEPDK